MLYALIGTGLVGALSTVFLLWLREKVKRELDATTSRLTIALSGQQALSDELVKRVADHELQLQHAQDELNVVKGQRDEALTQLSRTGAPGSITDLLRGKVGIVP